VLLSYCECTGASQRGGRLTIPECQPRYTGRYLCTVYLVNGERSSEQASLVVEEVEPPGTTTTACFYARKQLLLSARLSHRNSVCLSVCLSDTRVDQSKTVQARITKSSPSAAWRTLVSGTIKLFHKFEGGHPK